MKEIKVNLRWWTFSQNNSGGYFIENEDVGHYVAIQAVNVEHAISRAGEIFADNSEYCECCGERWYLWVDEDEGTETPEIYGEDYRHMEPTAYRKNIILHYVDGTKEKYVFGGEQP